MNKKVAVVLTRAGSSRVLNKNSRVFYGKKSLLELKLSELEAAGSFDLIISATNCESCENQSKRFEKVTSFIRSQKFCEDSSGSLEGLNEVVKAFGLTRRVTLFQCTSPFFGVKEIQGFCNQDRETSTNETLMTAHKSLDDIWTVEGKRMFKNAPRRQQEREGFYIENSAAYSFPIKSGSVAFDLANVKIQETTSRAGIDINTEEDFFQFSNFYKAVNG